MRNALLPIIILILAAIVGYFVFAPSQPTPSAQPTQQTKNQPAAVDAIIAYAAMQFTVTKDQVEIISTKKQTWDTICLGMNIPDYDCTKQKISGYEVTMKINGETMSYRGTDDGKIIRFVKQ